MIWNKCHVNAEILYVYTNSQTNGNIFFWWEKGKSQVWNPDYYFIHLLWRNKIHYIRLWKWGWKMWKNISYVREYRSSAGQLFLLQEYTSSGSLDSYLEREVNDDLMKETKRVPFFSSDVVGFLHQSLSGLEFIVAHGVYCIFR